MSLATVRDLALILLAIESLFVGLALIILILQIGRLTKMLREEVKPILESARETVGTVRGTTKVISETVVSPLARTAGVLSAIGIILRILRRRGSR